MAESPPHLDPTPEEVKNENLRFLRGLQRKALRKLTTPYEPKSSRTAKAK
jgi:hypothetical protein